MIIKYLSKYKFKYFYGAVLLTIVNLIAAYIPKQIKYIVDKLQAFANGSLGVTTFEYNDDLNKVILVILVLVIIMAFVRVQSRTLIFGLGRQIEYDLKSDIFKHLLSLEPGFFKKNKAGDLISVITNDVQAFRALGGFALLNIMNSIIAFTVIVPQMWSLDSQITIYFLLLIPVLLLIVGKLSNEIKAFQAKVQDKLGNISHFVEQNLSAIHIIKAYAQEENEIKHFENQNNALLQDYLKLIKARSYIMPVMRGVIGLGLFILLFFGGFAVIKNQFTLGDFAAYSLYIERLIWPINSMGWLITVVYRVFASTERISNVLDTKPQIKNITGAKPISTLNTEIQLNTLGAKICKGQKIGIVGPIASGKSHLARQLMHLEEIERGEIFIDGRDLMEIELNSLRSVISLVPQDNFLFSTSVYENINYATNHSLETVIDLAKLVSLHDEVLKFNQGYDTIVGEKGVTLSGGQRQRVAIARALALNPEVLILDDSLSSVDDAVAKNILDGVLNYRKGKTTIFISHKMSIMPLLDNILVMDQRAIIESGNHFTLLSKSESEESLYKKLWQQKEANQ